MVGLRESERFRVDRGRASPESRDADATPRRASRLLCAGCRGVIADDPQRIEMNGTHAHTFTNPAGIVFHLGCFADAPGATSLGGENSAFSWFPGFVWRIAVCAQCGEHLGWRFRAESANAHFFGLILDRVVEERA